MFFINKIFYSICLIGRINLNFFASMSKKTIQLTGAILNLCKRPLYAKQIWNQFITIGLGSLPIVSLTAIFTGSVLALQTYVGFSRLSNTDSIPLVVVISITRELGPVLTALMLSGRVTSAITSEIGAMKVSDQLSAISIMGIDHIRYLLRPRLLIMLIFMPLLTLVADILGIFGGYLISITKLGYNAALYEKLTFDFLQMKDVFSGLQKSVCFGFIIVMVGYYFGFSAAYGSSSVGNSTKSAVVSATSLVLVANYFLTYLLFE